MEIEKIDLQSADGVQANIEKMAEAFPNLVTEGPNGLSIDWDALRQEFSDQIVEGPQERYRLDWPGKRAAMLTANTPISKTLRPVREESVNFETTQNLFIEGDNLDALKLLQDSYLGKVKMIYIDPPYNTGKDFIYKDNFTQDKVEYLEESGQVDEDGGRLVANPDSNGRFHSDWLSMIYPRLKLARNLLKDDGAIFLSCDESEHPRVRAVMDQVFGQANLIADMVWAGGRKNDSKHVSVSHEYIICYSKNLEYLKSEKIIWRQRKKGLKEIYAKFKGLEKQHPGDFEKLTSEMKRWFKELPENSPSKAHKHFSHVDGRGLYFPDNISWPGGGGPKYDVLHPDTNKPVKIPSRGWITSDERKMQSWIDDNRVHFGADETKVPCIKSYLLDKEVQTPYSVFYQDGRAASKRLRGLMGGDFFEFPKDEIILQEIIEMLSDSDDIIVDFFAGSGTTAQSVFMQNAKDKGARSVILVQLPEDLDVSLKRASKPSTKKIVGNAIELCLKNEWQPYLTEVTKERIRRAGKKVLKDNPDQVGELDVGFRVLKIDSSNMKDVHADPRELKQGELLGAVSHIKPDRNGEDLLFQVMLNQGVKLSQSIARETVEGKTVYSVEQDNLIACFDDNITDDVVKNIASRKPLYAIFRDESFKEPADKINAAQIFKQLTEGHTRMKVI